MASGKPIFAFELWASGVGDLICAEDKELSIHPITRVLWWVRGNVLKFLFGWWWWERDIP
jgi:hypothetical protein